MAQRRSEKDGSGTSALAMTLFDPDSDLPFWLHMIPLPDDLAQASDEQREMWVSLNAHVSYVHTSWSNMEYMLSFLFAAVLRIKVAQATVILGTLNSNKIKRDLIQNCTMLSLTNEEKIRQIERVLRRIAKVSSKRNFLAHGIGGFHQKYPDRITVTGFSADLKPALSHYLAFGLDDLAEIRSTLDVLSGDIQRIVPAIWRARRRALPETPLQTHPDDMGFVGNHRQPPREKQQIPRQPSPKKPRPKKLSSAQKRAALHERERQKEKP